MITPSSFYVNDYTQLRRWPNKQRDRWGVWILDRELYVLYTDKDSYVGYRYEIDLESCIHSARVLDWICQIAGKQWGTPEQNATTVADLVAAFVDVLNPQGTLCSWGHSKRITRYFIRGLVDGDQ